MPPLAVAVCVSGRGSNLTALLDSLEALGAGAPAVVRLVLSNRADAGAVAVARDRGIGVVVLEDPADDVAWRAALDAHEIGLIVLAGYLKLVPAAVIAGMEGRIINIHPALLPDFGGPGMYGLRVHRAVLDAGATISGATVHVVTEAYDRGRVLGQATVSVFPADTPELLAARVLHVEHQLLPAAVIAAAKAGRPVAFSLTAEPAWVKGSRCLGH